MPRAACLEAAVEMLTKSKYDFALLYVGKRQPDPVPAVIAEQVVVVVAVAMAVVVVVVVRGVVEVVVMPYHCCYCCAGG